VSAGLAVALVVLVAAAIAGSVYAETRRRGWATQAPSPSPRRILFPFFGTQLSQAGLDTALRLCRAEGATLVPAYLAKVPLSLPLDSPLPRQASRALPVLEAIEQQGLRSGVPVDARIERGRTYRHAVRELLEHEHCERMVTPAAADGADGFSPDDIGWLLDNTATEVMVFRPASTTA
jgi:hypothetical protein